MDVVRVDDRAASAAGLRAEGCQAADLAVDLSEPGGVSIDREFPAGSTEREGDGGLRGVPRCRHG